MVSGVKATSWELVKNMQLVQSISTYHYLLKVNYLSKWVEIFKRMIKLLIYTDNQFLG